MLSRDEPPDHLVNIAARIGLGCLATGIMGLTVFQVVPKPPLTPQDYPIALVVLAFLFGLGVLCSVLGKKALHANADNQKGSDPRRQPEPAHKKRSRTPGLDRSAEALNVLGLSLGASNDDIDEAYRILAKVWHPDRYMDDPQLCPIAEAKIKRINWAFGYLKEFPPEVTREKEQVSKRPANRVAAHSTSTALPAGNPPSCAGEYEYDIRRVFSAGTPWRQRIGWLFGMAGGSFLVGGVAYQIGYPAAPLVGIKGLLLLSGVGLVGVSNVFGFPKYQGSGGMDVAKTVGMLLGAAGMLCAFGSGFITWQNSWSEANAWLIAKCVCASLTGMMVYVGGRNYRVENKGVSLAPKRGQHTCCNGKQSHGSA